MASVRHDAIVYMRDICLEVVLPEQYVWKFMHEFGEAFAKRDMIEGGVYNKPVDGYFSHPNGWHVKVTVWDREEAQFHEFFRRFCKKWLLVLKDNEDLLPAVKDELVPSCSECKAMMLSFNSGFKCMYCGKIMSH